MGVRALEILAKPHIRALFFLVSLLISAYLVYVFGYAPLTEGVELQSIAASQQAKLNEDALRNILAAGDERVRAAQENFSSVSTIFSHAIEQ